MQHGDGKVGVGAATMLVAGNMMGSGVFLSSLAKIGTIPLLPYIYSCVACYFAVEESGKTSQFGLFWVLTSLTVLYCLWAIFGATPTIVQYAMIFILFITPFYPFFSERRRQQGGLPR